MIQFTGNLDQPSNIREEARKHDGAAEEVVQLWW